MDYELKYVIAICLIVKIAALSPELSINEETEEKPEKIPFNVETSPFLSFPDEKMSESFPGQRKHDVTFFKWGSGGEKFNRMNNKKDIEHSKRMKENQSSDTCEEHKLELLESSRKWRDIRKTLHWLSRIIASNQTSIGRCHKGKSTKHKKSFHAGKQSKTGSRNTKTATWVRNLRNNYHTHSNQGKKFRKEHKKKYWKVISKKVKNKNRRKEFKHEKKHKKVDFVSFSPAQNTTILKPNSVLYDFEKVFFKRTKTKGETYKKTQKCNIANNLVKKCETVEKVSREPEKVSKNHTEIQLREQNHENKPNKTQKTKPWPHFVYHRVSSNFLHPELTGQNHGKSAYIAISVVSDDKSDSIDNNNNNV